MLQHIVNNCIREKTA